MPEPAVLLFCAGNAYDGPPSTDRRLATALAELVPVLWVDPPRSVLDGPRSRRVGSLRAWRTDQPAPGLRRLQMVGFPFVTRPLGRTLTALWYRWLVRRAARGTKLRGTVLANALHRFPVSSPVNVLYATDDWVSGAPLMGLDVRHVEAVLEDNVQSCDVLAAVSEPLMHSLRQHRGDGPEPVGLLLPNGCDPRRPDRDAPRPADVPEGAFAVLVGQLNERLDLSVLAALAERQLHVVVIGRRSERSGEFSAELDRLFRRPTLHHLGFRPPEELTAYLHWASVGLTPYTDTPFNRSSFPLKTLDYLTAGLGVVSSDLPASRWLASDAVALASNSEDFARLVGTALKQGRTAATESAALQLAEQHSWAARARTLVSALEQHSPTGQTIL